MCKRAEDGAAWNNGDCEGTVHCPPRCPRFVDEEGEAWTVRQVSCEESPALLAMYEDFSSASRTMGLPPRTDARREQWVDGLLDESVNVVAERNGRVVGHAFYTPCDDPEPEFGVFVHQDYRNRGIGTELSKHVIAVAAAAERKALTLEVAQDNWAARDLYDTLGFEIVEQLSYEHHGHRTGSLGMRLSLTSDIAFDAQTAPAFEAD